MRDDVTRYEAMRQRTKEVLALAEQLYGVKIDPAISFNLRGRVAGWAGCKLCSTGRQYSLRFNCELIQGKHFDDMVNLTVPHEVAHLVCYARPDLGSKHDAGWRRVCLALGGNGQRCHNYEVAVKGRWDYITDRGNKVSVTRRHHTIVQSGGVLRFKRGLGTIDRFSPCAPSGQPIPQVTPNGVRPANVPGAWPTSNNVAPPAPKSAPPAALPGAAPAAGETWASQVRRLIALHKPAGGSMEQVVAEAVALGMKRSSAVNCVKFNWHRI